jgi:hypothetical protein
MKNPKKIIINNPDQLYLARYHIGELIDDAITVRKNMADKSGCYTYVGKHCNVLSPNRTRVEYDNDVEATTYFNYGVLKINLKKL